MWKGYLYMAVLVLLNILKTLLTSQNIYQLAKLGLRIRTALTSSLYKKALSLNPKARQEQSGRFWIRCQRPKYKNEFKHLWHLASGNVWKTNDENL